MAIRLPLVNVGVLTDSSTGGASVAGMVTKTFTLPQDTDGVVVKLTASLVGASASATLQTTDDGGTTWYDVARTPTVTLANNAIANWIAAPTFGMGIRSTQSGTSSLIQTSVLSATGSAAASTLGAGQVSGLPLMSQLARIGIIYTGNITTNDGVSVQVKVAQQSATA